MPVTGAEIASLDFANLIGGPLNAIVEAQAKSAITTTNFIREVGFTREGKIINVDFSYSKKNAEGKDQRFSLTVPFLTMIPIPYITVVNGVIEFNAKITSINESSVSDQLKTEVDLSVSSGWFVSARLTSKTSYQKQTSASERAERAFDMHVRVEVANQDMPRGTERLLDMLEESLREQPGPLVVNVLIRERPAPLQVKVESSEFNSISEQDKISLPSTAVGTLEYTIASKDNSSKTLTLTAPSPRPTKADGTSATDADVEVSPTAVGKSVDVEKAALSSA